MDKEDMLNITGNFISTELDFIEKCNKEKEDLQKENDCLWERIKYLLTSRTVRMYDEVDPVTKKHKFDISDLDNLQQRIDKAISKCKERIEYCKELQSADEWECCIEELESVCKILEDNNG